MTILSAQTKLNKSYQKTTPLYFLKVKYIKNNLFSFLYYSFVETLLNLKLNILVTELTETLNFNFVNTVNPYCSIMPL